MNGWDDSAAAWVASQGEHGDFLRRYVLDPAISMRLEGRGFATALDVGCGEGRFCRVLRGMGIDAAGIDPTEALIARARKLDPTGDYRITQAEELPFADGVFDLVVSYVSLVDIPGYEEAIAEMARVLKPGGTLLIANVNGFMTAHAGERGWQEDADGNRLHFAIDNYLDIHSSWESWGGLQIQNWHRPLSAYMKALLGQGLQLVFFDEPAPIGGSVQQVSEERRVPGSHLMEWRKP